MHYSKQRHSTKPVHWDATILQPPLGDGSFMVPMNDPLDSIHAERQPEQSVDRHREMVMLDRLFWASVGLLIVTGLALKIWILF